MTRECFLNAEICTKCSSKCCKQMPGETVPDDFTCNGEDLPTAILQALESGKWVIDWWEGDPRDFDDDNPEYISSGYYVRPRAKNDRTGNFCPSWSGECVFLSKDGCTLAPEDRPTSCRLLEPKQDGNCIMHDGGGKHAAAMAWLPYWEMLHNMPRG